MFSESSRYAGLPRASTTTSDGREADIVRVRRLGDPPSDPHQIMQNQRLDIISQQRYADPTRFWRIADANTELEADDLIAEPGRFINVPER